MFLRWLWPLALVGCQDLTDLPDGAELSEAVTSPPAASTGHSTPRFEATASENEVVIRGVFSSYCSPEPTLKATAMDHTLQVSVEVPDGNLARCVQTWHRTARVSGLPPGTYTVRWAAGGLDDQVLVVGSVAPATAYP